MNSNYFISFPRSCALYLNVTDNTYMTPKAFFVKKDAAEIYENNSNKKPGAAVRRYSP